MSQNLPRVQTFNGLVSELLPASLAPWLAPPLEFALALRRLGKLYASLPTVQSPSEFADVALKRLQVDWTIHGELGSDLQTGPLLVVANHPYGVIDGLLLYRLLSERRSDVRVLGNRWLTRVPEFSEAVFAVDVLAGRSAVAANAQVLRESVRWLRSGGVLLAFPAGEVASFNPPSRTVADPAWHPAIATLARLSRAPVLPVHISGRNSLLFHAAGLMHPRLRTALLAREVLNKARRMIAVRLGRVLPCEPIDGPEADQRLLTCMRLAVHQVGCAATSTGSSLAHSHRARVVPLKRKLERPVVGALPISELRADVAALPISQRIASNGDFEVWHARAVQLPAVLQEIGRLRELTFRVVGEGTGRSSDLDLFDDYYEHLFVWNRERGEVVGAYRAGAVGAIVAKLGSRGLYTSTLFSFDRRLLPALGDAVELGRSFIAPAYQRTFSPLLLLWKGIAGYVVRHPDFRTLYGTVSISNDYSPVARALITGFLGRRYADDQLARYAVPRNPLPNDPRSRLFRREGAGIESVDALDAALMGLEMNGKGMPVLLRQYLKLGARVIAFNVDAAFGHSIDVLVAVDLLGTDPKVLTKYMGHANAERYRSLHAVRLSDVKTVA